MTNWLTRHYWIAALAVVLLALAWFYLLVPAYQDCYIAEIDRIRERVDALRSERDMIFRTLSLSLDRDGNIADVVMMQEQVDKLEYRADGEFAKALKFDYIVNILIVILGVCLQLVLAGCLVYLFHRFFYRRFVFETLLNSRRKEFEDLREKMMAEDWPKTSIAKVLGDKADIDGLHEANDWRKYLDEISQGKRRRLVGNLPEPIDVSRLSTVLFNTAKIMTKTIETMSEPMKSDEMKRIKDLHSQAQRVLRFDLGIQASRYLLSVFSFFAAYFLIGLFTSNIGLPVALLDRTREFTVSITFVLVGWCVAFLLLYFFQGITRYFTDKSTTDLDDIIVGIVSTPIITIGLATSALIAFNHLPVYFSFWLLELWGLATSDGARILITAMVIIYFAVAMFNRILVHSLERWSLQTKQKYDDLLVQILKLFGSFFIVAFSGAILLVDFQSDIKQATGIDNILLPYTIVVSVLTAIIGYSTQEGVQNFFGGLLLQIEKPFELGDRIVLDSGEICDVRTLGIRSTTFYNILENTEISIPNRLVSNQPITNLSRPNLELRVSTTVHIPFDKKGTSLQRTESVLLDIAAKEEEIDLAWLSHREQNRDEEKLTGRKSVEERVTEIRNSYTNLATASVRRLSGNTKPIEVFDEEKGIFKKLSQVTQLREQYDHLRETTGRKSIYSRYKILKDILQRFGEIGEFIYSLGTVDPDARVSDAYLQLVDEVSIEPSVYSRYMITEEGRAYLEVTLRVYTTHLERRFEVSHKINKEIQKRFAEEGIKILSIGA